jgi:hypothetical protein
VIVGVSGHQKLGDPRVVSWVKDRLRDELIKFVPSAALSSLAIGTDQIFANVALELGWALHAVIPCSGYEATFSEAADRTEFLRLSKLAVEREVLEFAKPSERAFLKASHRIVERSQFMLIVWNGLPARGVGGTADTVAYAKRRGRPFIHINPIELTVTRQPR